MADDTDGSMIDPGEPERPWEPYQPEDQESRPRRALAIVVAVLAIVLLVYSRSTGRLTWVVLCGAGSFLAYSVVRDISRGRTSVDLYRNDPRRDYVRSADPVGFWVVIAIKGASAATAVVFGLGLLLGIWQS